MKLYELPPAFAAIEALSEEGELTPEMIERIASLEMELEAKIENICRLIRAFEAKKLAYQTEYKRLSQRAGVCDANIQRLKEYMRTNLEAMGVDKVDTQLFTVRLQRNPMSCNVSEEIDLDSIPAEYKTVKVDVNKSALIDAFKRGETLPEGVTVQQTKSLRIQ